jgi:hypothetical protein
VIAIANTQAVIPTPVLGKISSYTSNKIKKASGFVGNQTTLQDIDNFAKSIAYDEGPTTETNWHDPIYVHYEHDTSRSAVWFIMAITTRYLLQLASVDGRNDFSLANDHSYKVTFNPFNCS